MGPVLFANFPRIVKLPAQLLSDNDLDYDN
jgi:hypothetical protein